MPLGRLGTVEDVAEAALFLLGDAASWITGQVFAVDGGNTLRGGPDITLMSAPALATLRAAVRRFDGDDLVEDGDARPAA